MPTKKPTQGGARAGAGRKPQPKEKHKIPVCIRMDTDLVSYCAINGLTATIENAVRESAGFILWSASRK